MIDLKMKPFVGATDLLTQWSLLLHGSGAAYRYPNGVPKESRDELAKQLRPLMEQLTAHEFNLCRLGGERLLDSLKTEARPEHLVLGIDDLRRRLIDQADLSSCLSLSARERDLYEPCAPLFGILFEAKFGTNGVFELDEAAKCLALGRATASVFHLMRLMEIAVRAVARCLNIPDPVQPADRNWGAILQKVRDGINTKWTTVATRSTGDGEIFDALYASLDAVKNPWRNSTMHPANKYTVEEAEHILAAVRGFVMKLADRCDENGDPKA
jgi:hypothetical protein